MLEKNVPKAQIARQLKVDRMTLLRFMKTDKTGLFTKPQRLHNISCAHKMRTENFYLLKSPNYLIQYFCDIFYSQKF